MAGVHLAMEGEEQVVIKWMVGTGLEDGRKMEVITGVEDGRETETEIVTEIATGIENGIGTETETDGTGGRGEAASIVTGNVPGARMEIGSEQGGREQKEEVVREAEEPRQKETDQGGQNGVRGPHAGTKMTV